MSSRNPELIEVATINAAMDSSYFSLSSLWWEAFSSSVQSISMKFKLEKPPLLQAPHWRKNNLKCKI